MKGFFYSKYFLMGLAVLSSPLAAMKMLRGKLIRR